MVYHCGVMKGRAPHQQVEIGAVQVLVQVLVLLPVGKVHLPSNQAQRVVHLALETGHHLPSNQALRAVHLALETGHPLLGHQAPRAVHLALETGHPLLGHQAPRAVHPLVRNLPARKEKCHLHSQPPLINGLKEIRTCNLQAYLECHSNLES